MRKRIYIILFAILYLVVAFSSLWHAIEFFGLANGGWMSIILATAFEIGQAAVLFALLSNTKDRKKVMPWVLMTMFTLVQVLGNVYSSYKHIMLNSVANLKYFKEPVFIWTDLPDNQATVIITYLVGGLLPISALLLTSMLTSFLTDEETKSDVEVKELANKELQKDEDREVEEDNVQMITDAAPEPITDITSETITDAAPEQITDVEPEPIEFSEDDDKEIEKEDDDKETHVVSI